MTHTMRRKLVAGNWKMYGSRSMASDLAGAIAVNMPTEIDVAVFTPLPYIAALRAQLVGSGLQLGAQDLSEREGQGAFTGDVSAAMLADVGANYVLVGHSERRKYHGESNECVARKFAAARAAGLTPILCVGETRQQRDRGETEAVIGQQLDAVLKLNGIASFDTALVGYEPVWAIGSGETATPQQAQDVHAFIRSKLEKEDSSIARLTRLIYGGSVTTANVAKLFAQADVDGALVGGAALTATDFLEICAAALPAP
jgi:triosephosphate isomerase